MKVRIIVNSQPQGTIEVTDDSIVGALLRHAHHQVRTGLAEMISEINQIDPTIVASAKIKSGSRPSRT